MIIILTLSSFAYATNLNQLVQHGFEAYKQNKPTIALQYVEQALEQDPLNINALLIKSSIWHLQNKTYDAIPLLEKIMPQAKNNKQVLESLAVMTNTIGLFDDALKYYELMYDQNINDEQARIKLPPLYMRRMEWHYALKFIKISNLWWYDYTIKDKKILLDLTSQWNGLGDVMQIIRYAKHLKNAGAYVMVKVRDELIKLLSLCPYIDQLYDQKKENPAHDHKYYLLTDNCTLRMRNTFYEKHEDVPYLYADPRLVETWHNRLRNDQNFKVGICWQATPMMDYYSRKIIPGSRSLYLHELYSLLDMSDISFYNLQRGEDLAIASCNKDKKRLITFESFDKNGAFMDTAALMKNLDLVITVDTSVAHLAGALGVPVWLLLPHAADFRWFSDRTDSPWYPTMRIFRQNKHYEWEPVIQQIQDALYDCTQPITRI
jgi:hypothetical protein